jgi:phosphomannomutase
MMDKSIFKAYDIRGQYPQEINEKTVAEIAPVFIKFFKKGKIIVGRDVRLSSPKLYKTLIAKLQDYKIKAISIGLTTTPMFYFLVSKLKAAGGIMVTASHNPKEYNGLKVVGKKAKMISGYEISKSIRKFS